MNGTAFTKLLIRTPFKCLSSMVLASTLVLVFLGQGKVSENGMGQAYRIAKTFIENDDRFTQYQKQNDHYQPISIS